MRAPLFALAGALVLGACVSDPYDYDDDDHLERAEEGVVIYEDDRYDRHDDRYEDRRDDRYVRRDENCYDRDLDGLVERHECYDSGVDVAVSDDLEIRREVLLQLDRYDLNEITVDVRDRDVYLSGWVDSYTELDLAEDVVGRVPGVGRVIDRDLRVG